MRSFSALSLISVLAMLIGGSAFADLKVMLVIIKPKAVVLDELLGHVIVTVTDTDTPDSADIYEYGEIKAQKVTTSDDLSKFFGAEIDLRVHKNTSEMKNVPSPIPLLPTEIYKRYANEDKKEDYRKLRYNVLNLTQAQARKFVELLDADVAKKTYKYHYYNNNGATRIRDLLFHDDVLGSKAKALLLSQEIGKSKKEVLIESMNAAIQSSDDQKMTLFSPKFVNSRKGKELLKDFAELHLQSEFKSGEEFFEAVKTEDDALQSNIESSKNDDDAQGAKSFISRYHNFFFSDDFTRNKPSIKYWDAMFAPQYLESGLTKIKNTQDDGQEKPVLEGMNDQKPKGSNTVSITSVTKKKAKAKPPAVDKVEQDSDSKSKSDDNSADSSAE